MGQMGTSSEEAVHRPGPLKGGGIGEEWGLATEKRGKYPAPSSKEPAPPQYTAI
jgi:hypothetical protein